MDINTREIKEAIEKIERLNNKIEEINDVLFAGQEEVKTGKRDKDGNAIRKTVDLSAERYDELNAQIDKAIAEIEKIQKDIENTLVNRALDDDKAKDFIDDTKKEMQVKVDDGKKEIAEYEKIEEKLAENEKLEKINALINERKELDNQITDNMVERQNLSYEARELEKEITELENLEDINRGLIDELDDIDAQLENPSLSEEERNELITQKEYKQNQLKENEGILKYRDTTLSAKRNELNSKKEKIKSIDNIKKENTNRIKDIEKELKELGVTNFDKLKLDETYVLNQNTIVENNKVIDNVKTNLKIEPEKVKDIEYIKKRAKQEIDKKLVDIDKIEKRISSLDEKEFRSRIKDSIMSEYGERSAESDEPDLIDDIITNVVMERRKKEYEDLTKGKEEKEETEKKSDDGSDEKAETKGEKGDEKKSKDGSSAKAVPTRGGIPIISKLTPVPVKARKEVGFFESLKENFFSREFKNKREEFARAMYPELTDKELNKYINNNSDKLNFLIRNGTTIKDVNEGIKIRDELRKEKIEKARNNPFLEKLKVDLGDKDKLEKTINEYAQEKAKKAMEDYSKDEDR